MDYIALKQMRVQELADDGTPKLNSKQERIIRIVKPGDPVPEAAHWRNLRNEIRVGRIGIANLPMPPATVLAHSDAAQRQEAARSKQSDPPARSRRSKSDEE